MRTPRLLGLSVGLCFLAFFVSAIPVGAAPFLLVATTSLPTCQAAPITLGLPGGGISTSCNDGTNASLMQASGTFDALGLALGTGVLIDYTSVSAEAWATVRFDDTITLLGGVTGETGYLQMIVDLDGTISTTGNGWAGVRLLLNDQYTDYYSSVSTRYSVRFPYVFGTAAPFYASMGAKAGAFGSGTRFQANVDFLSTAQIDSFEVLDHEGNPIEGGSIFSAAGVFYPGATVPEPGSSLILLGIGVAALAGRLYRRRR